MTPYVRAEPEPSEACEEGPVWRRILVVSALLVVATLCAAATGLAFGVSP